MTSRRLGCLLWETDEGWTLTTTGAAPPPSQVVEQMSTEDLVAAVEEFIERHRLRRDQLLIALHSNSTLFATFPVDAVPKLRDRKALAFQLESSLPLDAEQFVADFSVGERVVSGAAVNCQDVLPLVLALEDRGLLVQSIVPAAVLACQSLVQSVSQAGQGLVLWQAGDSCELYRITEDQLVQWQHIAAKASVLSREMKLQVLDAGGEDEVLLVDFLDNLAEEVVARCPRHRRVSTDGFAESVRHFAGQVLSGRRTPWFELRRDQLANEDPYRAIRKNVSWLTGAVTIVLLALAVAWWGRAAQLHERFVSITQQQRDQFQRTFPEARVPRAVVSRIQSEHVKMVASHRMSDEVPKSHSALLVLHGFLSGLPTDLRNRMTDIRIENGVVTADVELRSHDDAGVLAASLEQAGFTVDPPTTTQRDDQTIITQLRAQWGPESPTAVSAAPHEQGGAS